MSEESDFLLLQGCLVGGREGWERFVFRFAPYLSEVCRATLAAYRRPCGPQEVDDARQEVFLALLERDMRALRGYRWHGSVTSYLAAVAVARIVQARIPREGILAEETLGALVDPRPGPSEPLEGAEALERLSRELGRLAPRARLALTLQAEGASVREVGETLNLSEAAAAQLLSRSRAILRGQMGKRE